MVSNQTTITFEIDNTSAKMMYSYVYEKNNKVVVVPINAEIGISYFFPNIDRTNLTFETIIASNSNTGFNTTCFTIKPINYDLTSISLSRESIDENNSINDTIGVLSSFAKISSTFSYTFVSGDSSTNNSYFIISGKSILPKDVYNF